MHHYLILEWAEDPDDGTFTDGLDWHVSHPPTCIPVMDESPLGPFWSHECAIQYEIDNVGVDAFGHDIDERARCWSTTPAMWPIEFWHERIEIGWSVEHDTGIRVVDRPPT